MRRFRKHMQGVLRAVLACGMGVQILLGLAWLVKNIGGQQIFRESRLLLAGEHASGTLYSGILYRQLAALFSSHLWVLYGIQLAAAIAAAYALLTSFDGFGGRGLRLFGALALAAIPQAMQCHLAVLPWSLGTSLLLVQTALWRRMWKAPPGRDAPGDGRRAARAMGLAWLAVLAVLPLYAWFALPLLLAALWRLGRGSGGKGRLILGMAALALLLGCVTVNCGWDAAGWKRDLAASALSRTGWPGFQDDYDAVPQPLHDEIGLVAAREVSAYADGVERTLIPRLRQYYGEEEVTSILWELSGLCLKRNLKTDVKNIIWDLAAYHATPPILAMQLKGRGYDSYSGINYGEMKNRTPLLARFYVAYGSGWWWVMLGLAAAILACGGAGRVRPLKLLRGWLPVLAGAEWMILCFVLGGSGVMDYKKTLWVTVLWHVAALSQLSGEEGSGIWQQQRAV